MKIFQIYFLFFFVVWSLSAVELEEFSSLSMFMNGADGAAPEKWHFRLKSCPANGLTKDFDFSGKSPVLRLRSENKSTILSSGEFLPPNGRQIEIVLWARATGGHAKIRLLVLGDKNKWARMVRTHQVALDSKWKKYTWNVALPENFTFNNQIWFECRAEAGNNDSLIGSFEAKIPEKRQPVQTSGNMLENGHFLFGTNGYMIFCYGSRNKDNLFLNPLAHWEKGKLRIPDGDLFSVMFPYRPGRTYTGLVRIRKVGANTPAMATLILCPENYRKIAIRKVKLSEEFQNFTVKAQFAPSLHNLFWFRVDGPNGKGFFEIERMQLTEGDVNQLLPLPEVEMGGIGESIFDAESPNAFYQLRIVQNDTPKPRTVQILIRDLWGRKISQQDFNIPAENDHIIRFPVDTGLAGVFLVELKCSGFTGTARYHVLYRNDLSPLNDNIVGWHQQPLYVCEMTPFRKYIPAGKNFNRFFAPPRFEEPAVLKRYAEIHDRNLATLDMSHLVKKFDFGSPKAQNSLTPEVEKQFLKEIETFARHAAEGKVKGVELFNEPHLWRGTMPPEKVAHFYEIAYPILRKYAPNVKICGPCASNKDLPYIEKFLRCGGGKYIDILSFHSYNGDPDQGGCIENNQALRDIVNQYRPGLPLLNTETYYGIRGGKTAGSQEEARRAYFKDTELEHASVYAAFCASSLVSDVPFSAFNPYMLLFGIPASAEIQPFGAMAAINAFQHILGNVGKRRIVYPIDNQLRCLIFPDAPGGAKATIRNINTELNDRVDMELPETIQASDLFGNAVKGKKLHVGSDLHYLIFRAGCDPQKEIDRIRFGGLGFPVECVATLRSKDDFALKLRNRTAKEVNGSIVLEKLPVAWLPVNPSVEFKLAPQEEKILPIPMKRFSLNSDSALQFEATVSAGGRKEKILCELNAIPVRYARNWAFCPADYRKYAENALAPAGKLPGGRNHGAKDCSVRIGALWNQSGLMFSICVTDDVYVPLPVGTAPGKSFRYDNIQIYFDMKNDATAQSVRVFRNRSDDLEYFVGVDAKNAPYAWLDFAEGERYISEANRTTGLDPAVKVQQQRLPSGELEYRIFFPAEALYQIRFAPGTVFATAFLINDNDGNGRKQGITTTPSGTEPRNNQHLFPDLILLQEK